MKDLVMSAVLFFPGFHIMCFFAGSQKSAVFVELEHNTPCFVITLSHRDVSCPFVAILFNC